MKRLLIGGGLLLGVAQGFALEERATYQPIIDAKPFGDVAEVVDERATEKAAEEQKQKEEIAQKFRMCGITDTPDGQRKIAFLDETSGSVASYILAVGESENGFTLISADYDREHATLTKAGLTFTLGLGKGLIDTPPQVEEETEATTPPPAPAKINVRQARALPQSKAKGGSFKARLLQRQAAKAEAEQAKQAELQAAMTQQLEAANRRKEIERIKQGLAPTTPITLTAEEDAELVAAGVFDAPATPAQGAEQSAPQDGIPAEIIQEHTGDE